MQGVDGIRAVRIGIRPGPGHGRIIDRKQLNNPLAGSRHPVHEFLQIVEVSDSEAVLRPEREYRNRCAGAFPAAAVHILRSSLFIDLETVLVNAEDLVGEGRSEEWSGSRDVSPLVIQLCLLRVRNDMVFPFAAHSTSVFPAFVMVFGPGRQALARQGRLPDSARQIMHIGLFFTGYQFDFFSPRSLVCDSECTCHDCTVLWFVTSNLYTFTNIRK